MTDIRYGHLNQLSKITDLAIMLNYANRSTYASIFAEPPASYSNRPNKKKVRRPEKENPTFLDLLSDVAWKIVMTGPGSLIQSAHMLRSILDLDEPLTDLTFDTVEQQSGLIGGKRTFYDVYLQTLHRKFVLEMQNLGQAFFDRRLNVYGCRSISNQVAAGDEQYNYRPVTMLSFINFEMPGLKTDTYHHIFDGGNWKDEPVDFRQKFEAHIIELGKFNKKLNELESYKDKWLYLIKHMGSFKEIPEIYDNDIFRPVFERALFKTLKNKDKMEYLTRLDPALDEANRLHFREEEGIKKGIKKGKIEERKKLLTSVIAKSLQANLDLELISQISGADPEMINEIQSKMAIKKAGRR